MTKPTTQEFIQLTLWDEALIPSEVREELIIKAERIINEYSIRIGWRYNKDAYKNCPMSEGMRLRRIIKAFEKEANFNLNPEQTVEVLVMQLMKKISDVGITRYPRKELSELLGLNLQYLTEIVSAPRSKQPKKVVQETEPTDDELKEIENA